MGIKYLFIMSELRQMSNYLGLVKTLLDEQKSSKLTKAEESKNLLVVERSFGDLIDNWDKLRAEDDSLQSEYDLVEDFPRRLYSSFVTSWYSFVEDQLLGICDSLSLEVSLKAREEKSFGKGIYRAKTFLAEAAHYQICEEIWQELTLIGKIRNIIVHRGGIIPHLLSKASDISRIMPIKTKSGKTYNLQIDESLWNYITKHSIDDLTGTFYINLNFEYCEHLVKLGIDLFSNIYCDLELSKT